MNLDTTTRPHAISHLARIALDSWKPDPSKLRTLEQYIKKIIKYRSAAQECFGKDDWETAFIYYTRAATLATERILEHEEYQNGLNEQQKRNLNLHGIEIMKSMVYIREQLQRRITDWDKAHPEQQDAVETMLSATRATAITTAGGNAETLTSFHDSRNISEEKESQQEVTAMPSAVGPSTLTATSTRQVNAMIRRKANKDRRTDHVTNLVANHSEANTMNTVSSFLALENPTFMDGGDSSDSDSPKSTQRLTQHSKPRSNRGGSSSGLLPITTTSLSPTEARLTYPATMTEHQRSQGYEPGQSLPLSIHAPYRPGIDIDPRIRNLHRKTPRLTQDGFRKTNLPREYFARFLSIAHANTLRDLETCGILLGRDTGNKYVVTTMLIPKQHATNDTCTIVEEDLVSNFTEKRGLITLGWIHTHPTQSCFMSSVDLHTHAGFQSLLRESFAIICAPKSNPNVGIFRLIDSGCISAVFQCSSQEAFHPHTNGPMYTDADKGHVHIKDLPLEIVDLR